MSENLPDSYEPRSEKCKGPTGRMVCPECGEPVGNLPKHIRNCGDNVTKTIEGTYELGHFDLREEIDEILVPSAQTANRHCHLPAGSEGTETICKNLTRINNIRRKDIACYPDGHLNWCGPCLEEFGVLE